MIRLSRYAALFVLLFAVAGCSSVKNAKDSVTGWFNGGEGANAPINSKKETSGSAGPLLKYAATLRVNKYVDQRKSANPRLLGVNTQRVIGVSDNQLLLDQEISNLVTADIKKRFDSEGYQVLEGSSADRAMFEVSGVIKDLTLNVKERDEINIVIETTLKEVESGKVVWSGMVMEKNDRFAGVAGNNKDDILAYLNKELRIVSTKTVEAISSSLMASRSELFNLTPGTKPIPGVTVYVAPAASQRYGRFVAGQYQSAARQGLSGWRVLRHVSVAHGNGTRRACNQREAGRLQDGYRKGVGAQGRQYRNGIESGTVIILPDSVLVRTFFHQWANGGEAVTASGEFLG